MFDIGWTELLVIGVVALIVIGPKDLPDMFRTLGRFTAKARAMARDFSRAMEDAANESGVSDVTKDLKAMTNPRSFGMDKVKEAASKFESWDPIKSESAAEAPEEWGPNTQALSKERAEAAKKIHEHSARRTQERLDAEAAVAAAKADKAVATKPKTKAKSTAAKTAAARKTGTRKSAPKSADGTAAKSTAKAKKPATAKPATAKPATAKAATDKAGAAKPKATAKKPAAAKPATAKAGAAKPKAAAKKTTAKAKKTDP